MHPDDEAQPTDETPGDRGAVIASYLVRITMRAAPGAPIYEAPTIAEAEAMVVEGFNRQGNIVTARAERTDR